MDIDSGRLEEAITHGVEYLYHHQFPNGEFCAYIANEPPMVLWTATDSSVFSTAIISASLLALQEIPMVDEILKKSTFLFECQMERGGVWNHFTHRHELRKLCAADVDDTSCISAVFRARGINWPSPSNIPLLYANRAKNGLFYTWIVFRFRLIKNRSYWRLVLPELLRPIKAFMFWTSGEFSRNDIDAVVNANALNYIGENEQTKPVIDYLIKIIEEKREADCDTWYRNPLAVYYFISRNYYNGIESLHPIKEPITERILSNARPDGRLGENVLDTALAANSLMNLGYNGEELTKAIDFLITSQRKTGEWERWVLYWGGPKQLLGWGSEELTTGFCLEALGRFKALKNKR